jgi:MarR family transcriptional regulator, 2-MHQ and catechol-resistance regulon repressor
MQQLRTKTTSAVEALSKLLGAHATLTRELNAGLVAEHGLTMNEYGALLLLSRAGEEGMRRIDLATELQLSPSGITRLLDRLMAAEYVGKGECSTDARVSYAVLTDAGLAKLKDCAPAHVADIERLLGAVLEEKELTTLADLLGRLSDPTPDEPCTSPDD